VTFHPSETPGRIHPIANFNGIRTISFPQYLHAASRQHWHKPVLGGYVLSERQGLKENYNL